MNKKTLFKEINKEIQTLNNKIDKKIVKGRSYEKEARRHKELLFTLKRIHEDTHTKRRLMRKSPVRRSLKRGVSARIFPLNFA